MKKLILTIASFVSLFLSAAVPTVTVGTLSQNPDTKRVTIPYTLSAGDACVVTFDIQTNGANGYVSIGGEHLASAWGDVNRISIRLELKIKALRDKFSALGAPRDIIDSNRGMGYVLRDC